MRNHPVLLFAVAVEIKETDGLIFDAKLERVGNVPKNHAPDFFHN